MTATIARDAGQYSAVVRLTAIPASLALFLSLVSVYGLTMFAAAERAHEIAVRAACGARPGELVRLLMTWLHRPFVAGVLGGTALAAVGVWVLQRTALALDLSRADLLAVAAAVGLLSGTALIATVIPALRAARKDPWSLLKE